MGMPKESSECVKKVVELTTERIAEARVDSSAGFNPEVLHKQVEELVLHERLRVMEECAAMCDVIYDASEGRFAKAAAVFCAEQIRSRAVMTLEKTSQHIVEAGVDPEHQTDHCDDCQKKAYIGDDEHSNLIQTCSHTGPLTLCDDCYRKRGNGVR